MSVTTHRTPGETFAGYTDLVTVVCTCGITYAIPRILNDLALEERGHGGRWVHCPHGHRWHYTGMTTEQKLQRERDNVAFERSQREQAEASALAQKRAATRARNERDKDRRRVAHGVCPCCKRTFKALAKHMQSQHPDFVEADAP